MNTNMFVTYMTVLVSALAATIVLAADTDTEKYVIAEGPFQPNWKSLKQYECPEWFRDATRAPG